MKVLFIHGLASSGAFKTSTTLHSVLRPCEVIAPDVPIDPVEAWNLLTGICRDEAPDLIVGHSLGGFWAQKLRGYPRILINPAFHASILMRFIAGEVQYLSPRRDGETSFIIDEAIWSAYKELEDKQFEDVTPEDIPLVRAMFADKDEMVRCRPEFEKYYPGQSISYPGTHLPTHPEIKTYLKPLAEELLTVVI